MHLLSATHNRHTTVHEQKTYRIQDRMLTTKGNALEMRYKNICKGFQKDTQITKTRNMVKERTQRIAIITKKRKGETSLVKSVK